jgi:hypothetical protein
MGSRRKPKKCGRSRGPATNAIEEGKVNMTATFEKAIRERPILFSGPMIRAILEGRKTQTRRVVKPMPFIDYPTGFRLQKEYKLEHHVKCSFVQAGMLCDCHAIYEPWKGERIAACPYGKPGDRLWVRETWASIKEMDDIPESFLDLPEEYEQIVERTLVTYRATPRIGIRFPGVIRPVDRMTYLHETTELEHHYFGWPIKWKPSIFMPRWASRIILEVADVRVEQLQSISEADAIAEGIEPLYSAEAIKSTVGLEPYRFGEPVPWTNYLWHGRKGGTEGYSNAANAIDSYRSLWESINAKKYPWANNPFVWVVEFKRVEVPA